MNLYCCFIRPCVSPLLNERTSLSFISRSIAHFIRENMVSLGQFSREFFERGLSFGYQLLTLCLWEQTLSVQRYCLIEINAKVCHKTEKG